MDLDKRTDLTFSSLSKPGACLGWARSQAHPSTPAEEHLGSAFQVAILFSPDHLISPLLLPHPFLFQLFSPQPVLSSSPGFLSLSTTDIRGHIILGGEGPSCALFSSILGPFSYTSGAPSTHPHPTPLHNVLRQPNTSPGIVKIPLGIPHRGSPL